MKKYFEFFCYCLIIVFIAINAILTKDSIFALLNAIFGILYTISAGKGRVICYLFGLLGSGFYCYLAFINSLWGNFFLYILYYIPLQIIGFFKWKKHLNKKTNQIFKTKLSNKERLIYGIIYIAITIVFCFILTFTNDKNPILDGIITISSIFGMYLTLKRAIEQWLIWTIVNFLSLFMWIDLIIKGQKTISTAIAWFIYLILGIVFYIKWKKEITTLNQQ